MYIASKNENEARIKSYNILYESFSTENANNFKIVFQKHITLNYLKTNKSVLPWFMVDNFIANNYSLLRYYFFVILRVFLYF